MRVPLAIATTMMALTTLAQPAVAQTDPALARMLADAAKAPMVPFERTIRAERLGNKETNGTTRVDRFNPRAPAGRQWTLVSIDGRPPTSKETAEYVKEQADAIVPGFHRLPKMLGGPATRHTDSQGRTVFRWKSLLEGAIVTPGGDISKNLLAEALIEDVDGKPQLSTMRVYAAGPFTLRGPAKMNAFDSISRYQPGPGGVPFLVAQTQSADVKAPFGFGGKRRTQISFRPL
jgi:hypothetical protein